SRSSTTAFTPDAKSIHFCRFSQKSPGRSRGGRMPRAEILRIIDVHGEPPPSSNQGANGVHVKTTLREGMIGWRPVDNVALALRRPKPTIALEHADLPESLDARLVMLRDPTSSQARAYRALRHRLLSTPDIRVIAITSARPGDGKTTCAANLAL